MSDPVDPNSTGYPWVNFTATLNAGVSVSSGTVTRTAGSSGYGAAYAQANEQIAYGTGAIAVQVASASDVMRFGLTNTGTWNLVPSAITAASNTSLTGPTFGISLSGSNGNVKIYNQEANGGSPRMLDVYSQNSIVQAGDWLLVYSDEGTVKYYRDRAGVVTLLYTSDHNPVSPFYPLLPQISISSNGSGALVKVLQPPAWGTAGVTYVATTGTTYGAGTVASPTTLALAKGGTRPVGTWNSGVSGNNTVSIADGTYTGPFTGTAVGSVSNQLVFQATNIPTNPLLSPTVILTTAANVSLWTASGYETLKDVDIRNTSTVRTTSATGSSNQAAIDTMRNTGWRSSGTGNQLINSTVHDHIVGIASQSFGGTIIRGVSSYNSGITASDGPAGMNIYVHNEVADPTTYITDSVFGNGYSMNVQYYNNDSADSTGNLTFQRVAVYNQRLYIAGAGVKTNVNVLDSHVWNSSLVLGQSDEMNVSGTFTGNYSYGQGPIVFNTWLAFTCTGNKFVGKATVTSNMTQMVKPTAAAFTDYTVNSNTYYRGNTGSAIGSPFFKVFAQGFVSSVLYTFTNWKLLPLDQTDSLYYDTVNEAGTPYAQSVAVRPGTTDVYVLPNVDQSGRGFVVIWNWPDAANVTVNISTLGLVDGQEFTAISAQSGKEIFAGTYSSGAPTFSCPMTTDDPPISRTGDAASTPATTMPTFGAILIMPGDANPSAPEQPTSFARAWSFSSRGNPGNVALTWVNPTSGAAVIVDKSADGVSWSNVTTTAADAVGYTVTGLANTGLWYFRVRASKTGLESANVNPISIYATAVFCYVNSCGL